MQYCKFVMTSFLTNTASHVTMNPAKNMRGAFILFEGVDRCGKSTQASLLNDYFQKKFSNSDQQSTLIRFPDRSSSIGQVINSYLQSTSNLNDQAIHLLFSANRWESSSSLLSKLQTGTTLVRHFTYFLD